MTGPHTHKWSPIEDLPSGLSSGPDSQLDNYIETWKERRKQLEGKLVYKDFLERLRREWAIETGVIERLYSITEGASLTLIEQGLDAVLISHEDTDLPPERVVSMIRDHAQGLAALQQVVTGERVLSTSFIKELHQVMTASQDYCEALDQFGRPAQEPLVRGDYKKRPNSIQFHDGGKFEFCPPEQVSSEMDRLIELHLKHEADRVSPEIEAAWLHHRFSLIHPFQDGNGRIARCLATVVLLRNDWLPPVVRRADRQDYINALRKADDGDLIPLVDFMGQLQRRAIRQALTLSEEVLDSAASFDRITNAIQNKLAARAKSDEVKLNGLMKLCDVLQVKANELLEKTAKQLNERQSHDAALKYLAYAKHAKRGDKNAQYHYGQIVTCANQLGYIANFNVLQAWARLSISMRPHPRTEVLFSFHGIGKASVGIVGCVAMIYQKHRAEPVGENRGTRFGNVVPLSESPFEVTYLDDPETAVIAFNKWAEERVRKALATWAEWI